ncbi:MAG: hypothetical protein IJZ08_07340 [Clostridia bacterium]|nr:hypothetical protein [Clostridia bacterium]
MRGSEKRIIYVKDTGSKLFEEAYFVLRRGVSEGETPLSEDDMVREASRIVEEGNVCYPASARKSRRSQAVTLFFSGAGAAIALLGTLAWVIAWL